MSSDILHRGGNLLLRHVDLVGNLVDVWPTLVLLLKLVQHLADLAHGTYLVERQLHNTALLGEGLQNALANPPHSVGDELEATRLVELLSSLDQSEVSLVDQVGEAQPLVLILLRHRHDKPQISLGEFLQCFLIAFLDALGEFHLLVGSKQILTAYLLQILVERRIFAICYRFCDLQLSHTVVVIRCWSAKIRLFNEKHEKKSTFFQNISQINREKRNESMFAPIPPM